MNNNADMEDTMNIIDVNFVQTGMMDEGTGSLVIEFEREDGSVIIRTHRHVPEDIYDEWERKGCHPAMYIDDIEHAFPFTEETEDD